MLFSKEEENLIIESIKKAELQTSGEIKIHIEPSLQIELIQRTQEVFLSLNLNQTKLRNAVLVMIVEHDRKIAVWGDEGINKVVPENYWNDIINQLTNDFKNNNKCNGLCTAIENIGNKLKHFFPLQKDDINEISNTISYGKP
jgi:uncharacterized membrane protein